MEIYQDNPDEPNFANVVEIVGKEYFFAKVMDHIIRSNAQV